MIFFILLKVLYLYSITIIQLSIFLLQVYSYLWQIAETFGTLCVAIYRT